MDVFLTHKVWPPWGLHWKPILPWKIFLSQVSWDCIISQHGLSSGIFHLLNTTAATHIKPHGTPSCVFSQALVQGLTANPHSFLSFLPWHRTTCSQIPYLTHSSHFTSPELWCLPSQLSLTPPLLLQLATPPRKKNRGNGGWSWDLTHASLLKNTVFCISCIHMFCPVL